MKFVPDVIASKVGRQILLTQKNSPTLLFAVGTVGVIATAVLAARATLHVEEVLDRTARDLQVAEEISEDGKSSSQETRNMIIYIRTRGVLEIGKLYAPAVIVGVGTIAALTGSHRILTRRNAGLTAAYKAIEKSFDDYRKRVAEEFGDEKENDIRKSVRKKTVTDEKGKKVEIDYVDPNGISQYAKFFDEFNPNWEKRAESNLIFLRAVQTYSNQLLHSRGHVLLNDVYDSLAIERTKAGCVVGWVLSPDGDGFIDFGIYNPENERAREFVNGNERSILLDFNVDGLVYDKI